MLFISYVGYTLLTLYLIYCLIFCTKACIVIINENRFAIMRYIPLRRPNARVNDIYIEVVRENKLETIDEI
jgi:hypothetical protein